MRADDVPSVPPPATSRRGFRLLRSGALIVPLMLFAATAWWTYGAVQRETHALLLRTVDMLHEHALRAFETQEAVLAAVDSHVHGMSWDHIADSAELHAFLQSLTRRTPSVHAVALADPQGLVVASSGDGVPMRLDIQDREPLRMRRPGSADTHVGGIVVTRPDDTSMFSLSRERIGDDGVPDGGVIVSAFPPDFFHAFYRSLAMVPGDAVTLVREDGLLLARVPELPEQAERRWHGTGGPVTLALEAGGRGVVLRTRSPVDGRERLYAARRVDGYPVAILYGIESSVIRDTWLGRLAVPAAVCLLAAVLLLAFTDTADKATRREREALEAAHMAAEAQRQAEDQLRHAQRLEALGHLTSGVAHDVNNLLTVIRGSAARLRTALDPEAEPRAARYLDAMDQAVGRGEAMMRRLLANARREPARMELLDLAAWLPTLHDTLQAALRASARVVIAVPDGIRPVRVDAAALEAALINLAANARDAIVEAGIMSARFTIEARNAEGPAPDGTEGAFVVVTTTDTGPGMPPEVAAHAFEPFFTTKPTGVGTGLGLAQVWGFARSAGGTVTIESAPGQGTAVEIWLPRAEGLHPPSTEEE